MTDSSPENTTQDKYLKTKQNKKSTNLDTIKLLKTKNKENPEGSQRKKDTAFRGTKINNRHFTQNYPS